MNDIQKCVLDILKYSLFSGGYPSFDNIELYALYKEMYDQTVLGFSNDVLDKMDIEEKLKDIWVNSLAVDISQFYSLLEVQQDLIELLNKYHIQTCILKGSSASKYYPVPEYRKSGDIDIIVKPEMFNQAHNVLMSNDYHLDNEDDSRHNIYMKNRVIIELHRSFSYVKDIQGEILDSLIIKNIDNCVRYEIEGYYFTALPDLINGLVLLMHLNEHIKRGVGLRHLLDWTMFVYNMVDDNCWDMEFKSLVQSVGLEKLAKTATRTAQLYLGLPEKSRQWCLSVDNKLCTEFIEYILNSGNFGSKNMDKNGIKEVSLNVKETGNFFKYLQEAGKRNWSAAKKYPVLKHLAWTYQLYKYARQIISYKRPIQRLIRDKNEFKNQIRLLKQFGVTQLPED